MRHINIKTNTNNLHNYDANIDPSVLDIISFGKDITKTSIDQMTTPDIKRILALPPSKKTAKALYLKSKVPDLQKVLEFRKSSTEGLKSDLFARAYPVHSKFHVPTKRKRKNKKKKDEDTMLSNCEK